METGTARYGPVRRVVWGPEANYLRLPDWPGSSFGCARYLSRRLPDSLFSPAGSTPLRQRIDEKPALFVPEALLFRWKPKFAAAIRTREHGIYIPMARADGIVLLGNVGTHCRIEVDEDGSVKEVRWHLLRVVLSEIADLSARICGVHLFRPTIQVSHGGYATPLGRRTLPRHWLWWLVRPPIFISGIRRL